LTSNNSREVSDALKRRCLHLFLDFPDPEREKEIIKLKVPHVGDKLADEVVRLLHRLRKLDQPFVTTAHRLQAWMTQHCRRQVRRRRDRRAAIPPTSGHGAAKFSEDPTGSLRILERGCFHIEANRQHAAADVATDSLRMSAVSGRRYLLDEQFVHAIVGMTICERQVECPLDLSTELTRLSFSLPT